MKVLSIIVPVYNTEKYLRRCLDSVLVQEALPYLELIAVNDGSKDHSIDILREYQARFPENVVLIDKENGGHGSTINAGLKAATGKYLRVLDSDDWFDSANFIRYLEKLRDCDEDLVVTPYTQEYTYTGGTFAIDYSFFEHDHVYHAADLVFDDSIMYYTMASSSYKTSLLRKCGLKLFEKTFYVDMQYNIYPIPYLDTVRFLDYEVYRYFIGRPNQSMSQASLQRNYPNHEKVLRFLIDYYASFRGKLSQNQLDYMGLIIYLMYYTNMDLVCMKLKNRRDAYRHFKELDLHLKQAVPELYQRTNDFAYLRASRKLGYLNIRFFNKPFCVMLNLCRKLKKG